MTLAPVRVRLAPPEAETSWTANATAAGCPRLDGENTDTWRARWHRMLVTRTDAPPGPSVARFG